MRAVMMMMMMMMMMVMMMVMKLVQRSTSSRCLTSLTFHRSTLT